MSDLTLRNATIDDADVPGALHVAAWKETYAGIVPDSMLARLSLDARTGMWAKVLGEPGHSNSAVVIVLEDGARVTGFGSCGMQRDEVLRNAGFSGGSCHSCDCSKTISREIARNGGKQAYRATRADKKAWERALRPKRCRLACSEQLRWLVAQKLALQ